MRPNIQFWFSVGSTYTFLTVMRIGALADARGVETVWRPFSVRQLMIEQDNIPFRDKPIKAAYMWRDIQRRADMYGLKAVTPAPYPLSQWDLVNQIAVLAAREGWCDAFARETYRRWFEESLEPGVEPNLEETLRGLGHDPDRVRAEATSDANVAAYGASTDEARSLNIFGSPSFVTRGELFWGDDRLENALDWAQNGRL